MRVQFGNEQRESYDFRRTNAAVKRILLTGMSGTGKSSVIAALTARGFRAVDLDYGWSERGPDGDWLWQEDRVQRLLSDESGRSPLPVRLRDQSGQILPTVRSCQLLLSAPTAVLTERLRARTNNPYGKTPGELAEVLENLEAVEPLLRRTATGEFRTDVPLDQVVAEVLRVAL